MKFAHLSDIHLGFQKDKKLQKIEQEVFEKIMDKCILQKMDFILISGDIFHGNVPEMRVQKFAFAKLRKVYESGIKVYVVYGSHDYSPISDSVIDVLEKTGYIIKIVREGKSTLNKITLDFVIDEKTGAKITGLSGLTAGKDIKYYEKLDRESLESESGFKIFLFHGNISEMKTSHAPQGDEMSLSLLPKGFDYYAGGHMHKYDHQKFNSHPNVVYSGTPFAGYHADLEDNARGQHRGFVQVEFDNEVKNIEFVKISNVNYELIEINADNKKASLVNSEISDRIKEIKPENKIIIIKVEGEMILGKTSDVDLSGIRNELIERGAIIVNISKNKLNSKEYKITEVIGKNKDEIETGIFTENISEVKLEQKEIIGESGVKIAKKLLMDLKQPILLNEKKKEYQQRILQNVLGVLGLNVIDS